MIVPHSNKTFFFVVASAQFRSEIENCVLIRGSILIRQRVFSSYSFINRINCPTEFMLIILYYHFLIRRVLSMVSGGNCKESSRHNECRSSGIKCGPKKRIEQYSVLQQVRSFRMFIVKNAMILVESIKSQHFYDSSFYPRKIIWHENDCNRQELPIPSRFSFGDIARKWIDFTRNRFGCRRKAMELQN